MIYFKLLSAIVLISISQLVIKSRLTAAHGEVPASPATLFWYALSLMKDPWLWLAALMLITAAFFWYFALSRIPLGVTFAFASLAYPMMIITGQFFLGETYSLSQYLGCALIVAGILLIATY